MHQQLWGYKVEEKLYVGVREQKSLNTWPISYNCVHEPLYTPHGNPRVSVEDTLRNDDIGNQNNALQ
jgi:hypothetical protein